MKDNLCSILVNSCDKYEDAWYPFFELIKKYWSDCPYRFYLNTETKSYEHNGIDLTVLNKPLHFENSLSWGARIKECIKVIDSPYIILLLDDFFLHDKVNQKELESCLAMMNNDSEITAIYFKSINIFKISYEKNLKYSIISENEKYKTNLQAGLWRKVDLETLISYKDSPWSFEEQGYNRITFTEKKFLCSKAGTHASIKNCVFPYLTARNLGYGIWNGKWLWNNEKLFRKNEINIKTVNLERFSRTDMFLYYCQRMMEKIIARIK